MTTQQPKGGKRAIEKALPDPGEGRWWRITHNPKSRTNPITVQLMECYSGNRRAMSSVLGFEYTIADAERCGEAARTVLARVADYAEVVGEYGGE